MYGESAIRSSVRYDVYSQSFEAERIKNSSEIDSSTIFVDLFLKGIVRFDHEYLPDDKIYFDIECKNFKGDSIYSLTNVRTNLNFWRNLNAHSDDFDADFIKDELEYDDEALEREETPESKEVLLARKLNGPPAIAMTLLCYILDLEIESLVSKQEVMPIELKGVATLASYQLGAKTSVSVKKGKKYYSGTLLGNKYLVTDARIFNDEDVYVFLTKSDSVKIELIRKDFLTNIALAELVKPLDDQFLSVLSDDVVDLGQRIYSFGTAGSLKYEDTYVRLNSTRKFNLNGTDRLLLDGSYHIGYTGAPLYNEENELIGVMIASDFDDEMNLVFTGYPKQRNKLKKH